MNESSNAKPRVAFLGLGTMGSGMARRILGAGYPLTVYNRNRVKADALAAEGAAAAATPREAAQGAGVIISILADDDASREVWLGAKGALAGAGRGSVLIESSTATVGWIKELDAEARKQGCDLIDAPVGGSKAEAAAGTLRFLIGGPEPVLDRVRPLFQIMGKEMFHVGAVGNGARMKLINNYLAAVQLSSLAEAVALIEKSGMDRARALEVLLSGAPGSPLIKGLSARMVARDYDPKFAVRLMSKDIRYATGEGRQHGVAMTMAAAAQEVFQKAIAEGWGDKDFSSVVEPMRRAGS